MVRPSTNTEFYKQLNALHHAYAAPTLLLLMALVAVSSIASSLLFIVPSHLLKAKAIELLEGFMPRGCIPSE